MEDPQISTYRSSMKYNILLRRPSVGEQKKPTFRLPPKNFAYGIPLNAMEGGVKEAITDWKSAPAKYFKSRITNYTLINRASIQAGNRTLEDHEKFRKDHKFNRAFQSSDYNRTIQLSKIPDIAFGATQELREDIKDVLAGKYFREYMDVYKRQEQRHRQHLAQQMEKEEPKTPLRKMDEIRIAISHQQPKEPEPLWKMSRFSSIGPKISSWWQD